MVSFLLAFPSKPCTHSSHLNIDKDVCPVCRKEGGGSHILQCEGTRVWRDRWLERKFTGIHPEIGIKKIASNKT
jgi:hypothetical protein